MVRNQNKKELQRETATRTQSPTIQAQVTSVETTTDPSKTAKVVCNVITRRSDRQLRQVPVQLGDGEGHVTVPQVNDWVLVEFLGKRGRGPTITGFVHTQDSQPPLCEPGHFRREFRRDNADPLYIEAEPSDHSPGNPDVVRLGIKPDGVSDPTTEVAIDDSGQTTVVSVDTDGDIDVTADGDITLSAKGDIVIDEGGSTTPVAVQGHTHDFTYDGGGKNSSTLSGSTDTPNESGTEVEIE